MSLKGIQTRTQVVQATREFLTKRRFQEIIPQLASTAVPTEPAIYPFAMRQGRVMGEKRKKPTWYLNTSPEAYLKKALAAGIPDCFAIVSAFRNLEGSGPWHQPEFLMAEWYQKNITLVDQLKITQELVTRIVKCVTNDRFVSAKPWPKLSWVDLWSDCLQANLLELGRVKNMKLFAEKRGYNTDTGTWEQWFNQIADHEILPHFPTEPFFMVDYPAQISPLAEKKAQQPFLAERFELFINKVEIANGNRESFEEAAIRRVFEAEETHRRADKEPVSALDESFLTAIRTLHGQTWYGVGLGIDRLCALLLGTTIREIQII